MQKEELRNVAQQLLAPLAVPEPGKHSPYYQWRYYGALLAANPERFIEEIVESGSNSPYRDMFLQVFQRDLLQEFGVEAIDWSFPADGNQAARAYTLAQYSLLLDPADEELREELLGEALLTWQSIDGAERRSAARMLLPALALQGRLDVAKRLAQEMWDDCPEYEELLAKGEAKTDIAFSRSLVPFLGWVEP
ncbi:MAG: hypothetical protein KatS3mg111_3987 [Pirellulaceae bacterium]|nr:MAG: hypothetical protein KatS3mg111_3987 [Pirellulaceae bacterium]